MSGWRRSWPIAAGLLATLAVAGGAFASFSASVNAGALSVQTATLDAPTGLAASHGTCVKHGSDAIVLTWTASTSPAVGGYEIFRAAVTGGPYTSIGTVTGATTVTYTDSGLPYSTAYYYVVQASRVSWRSGNSGETTLTTLNSVCK